MAAFVAVASVVPVVVVGMPADEARRGALVHTRDHQSAR
jgi:hypothetical protein